MKKVLIKISLFILGLVILLSPFAIFSIYFFNQKHVYSNTYYAALVDKVHNLQKHKKEKKIVLIGGSNVAFGFNSKLIEEEFKDYKVVNFGLYAMLGTKIMMDLAIDYINPGDLVFIIPEINEQSTSLYFEPMSTLKALEDDFSLVWKLPKDNRDKVIGNIFNFTNERNKQKEIINPTGIYQRKSFNEYGDIFYEELDKNNIPYRSNNRMALHFDPSMMVDYSYEIDDSFYQYVNEYHKKISKKKANLYYGFSPVDEKAVINSDKVSSYYWSIRENLTCPVVGNPQQYILDAHYFYDSNFHLNDSGATLRSYLFAEDIYRDIFALAKAPSFKLLEMPEYPLEQTSEDEDSETVKYFNLKEEETGYSIVSIKEDVDLETIILPSTYNHKPVIGVKKDAFKGANKLKSIIVPTSYRYFENGAFDNATSLTRVYLQQEQPNLINVDFTGGLFKEVNPDFKICVPSSSYQSYLTDYNWQFYKAYLEAY